MKTTGKLAVVMAIVMGTAVYVGAKQEKPKARQSKTARVLKGKSTHKARPLKADKTARCVRWNASNWRSSHPMMRLLGPYKDALQACRTYLKHSDYKDDGKCSVGQSLFSSKSGGPFLGVKLLTISGDSMDETVGNLAVHTDKGWFFAPVVFSNKGHDRLWDDEMQVSGVKTVRPGAGTKLLLRVALHRSGFNTPEDADMDKNGDPLQQDEFDEDLRILCTLDGNGAVWCTSLFPVKWSFTHDDYSKGGEGGQSSTREGAFLMKLMKGPAMLLKPMKKAKIPVKFKGFEGNHNLVPQACRM